MIFQSLIYDQTVIDLDARSERFDAAGRVQPGMGISPRGYGGNAPGAVGESSTVRMIT